MRRDIERLAADSFDVAVVGGGIHGAWIALRAAQAGLRVALIEKGDFGALTSANSLKILHGGLRYLQHLDLGRMRSSIAARSEFGRSTPQLVRPLPCVMPLQAAGIRSPWILGPALLANEVLSFDRNRDVQPQAQVPAGHLLSRGTAESLIAPLSRMKVFAGAQWWDAIAEHAGRLVLEPLLEASKRGAVIANRAEATGFLAHAGAVTGLAARDGIDGREFQIRARSVVDASGPWAGQLSKAGGLPTGFVPGAWIVGVNLMFGRSLGTKVAVALTSASRSADSSALLRRSARELFFVPWQGVTMVGTDYHEAATLAEARAPTPRQVEQFLEEAARIAPEARLGLDDVSLVHWGIQPADAAAPSVPRKSPIVAAHKAETGLDGLVVMMGEKLTSAPILAHKVVAAVRSRLSSHAAPAPLGAAVEPTAEKLLQDEPALAAVVDQSTDVRRVDIVHAIRNEMALSLEDVVLRRLSIARTGHPGIAVLRACAAVVAAELRMSPAATDAAVNSLDQWFIRRGLPEG